MEEDQEVLKHVCKFCSKSFPSGRSLGGHIRSHMINSPFDHTNKKHNGGSSANCNIIIEASSTPTADYGLRENPKKTSKFDTLLPNRNKFCKECGKSFQSWKALFGHMKCHSDKVSSMNSTLEEESWHNEPNYAICHKQVMDSQSDSTETAVPNKKKRSLKKIKRYMSVTTSPCFSEIEQEEEEVAMSLIILSRDPGNWTGLNPFTKFSTNKDGELVKLKKVKNGKPEQGESSKSRIRRNVYKMDKSEVQDNKQNKIKGDKVNRIEGSEIVVPNKLVKGSGLVNSESRSKRRNFEMNQCDFNVDSNTKKKIKFQCTNCNKSFHSYQALGGHKASHKRTNKGCEKVVIHIEHLQNQAADNKLTKSSCSDSSTIDEFGDKVEKLKGYECPICFEIFQSGQALGGHKRSHLITESKSNNNKDIIIQKPTEEIRDLLDLNLPARVEEESSEHVEFQPWWIGSNHKHEQLLGLISN